MAFGDDMIDGYAEGEEPLVFHYKRDSFRRYEPKVYADLASGESLPKRGFFKVLVSSKGNRFMLLVLVIVFAVVLFVMMFGASPDESAVNGIKCKLSAFSYDGQVYVSLKMTEGSKSKDKTPSAPKNVDALFSVLDSDGTVINTSEGSAVFQEGKGDVPLLVQFTDYNIRQVFCQVSSGEESHTLKCKVKDQ